jgi:hypothetical protein
MKTLLAGLVIGMALSPSAPQAADVERVQAMCARLAKGAPPLGVEGAVKQLAHDLRAANGWAAGTSAVGVVDSRVYDLLCK